VWIPDLVMVKYFGNNTIEIKIIVFTYPDLLPPTLVVELEHSCVSYGRYSFVMEKL